MEKEEQLPLSGELEDALKKAQEWASADRAPAVTLEHLWLGILSGKGPDILRRLLQVAKKHAKEEWEEE